MKWVFLAIAVAAVLPLAGWLRSHPSETPKIWMLMGFLPFGVGVFHLYMAVISWSGWPGYVKGTEITALDLLALSIYISLPRSGPAIPFRLSMALYFFAVLISASQTVVSMASIFFTLGNLQECFWCLLWSSRPVRMSASRALCYPEWR